MVASLLFSIPLDIYITLSVMIMVIWVFFVATRLQRTASSMGSSRASRPEPTPFSFFRPGDNPTSFIPPSTVSDAELAIPTNPQQNRSNPHQASSDSDSVAISSQSASTVAVVPASVRDSEAVAEPAAGYGPEFDESPDEADYALFQPRQVSVINYDLPTESDQTGPPKTWQDLAAESQQLTDTRKRKTDLLMQLAEGVDFAAYVTLFRSYFEQALKLHQQTPERAYYVLFAELITDEPAEVQEQLLLLLDKEPDAISVVAFRPETVVTEVTGEEETAIV